MALELVDANATSATWKITEPVTGEAQQLKFADFQALPEGPLKAALLTPGITSYNAAMEVLAAAGFQSYLVGSSTVFFGDGVPTYGVNSTFISFDDGHIAIGAYVNAATSPGRQTCLAFTLSAAYSASE